MLTFNFTLVNFRLLEFMHKCIIYEILRKYKLVGARVNRNKLWLNVIDREGYKGYMKVV